MLVPLLVTVLAVAVLRGAAARRAERAYARRRPPKHDGVVPGAEGFSLEGTNGRALLLLHGSGDTPQTLRYLGTRLHDAGYAVHVPLLPGHGRGLREFSAATADDYVRSARAELDALTARSAWVGIVGLSMGGAIAARLAAERRDVRALAMLAPYLTPPAPVTLAARLAPLWRLAVPYLGGRGGEASVRDPVAREESFAYGSFPPNAVRALVATAAAGRRALPAITVPTLVVQSREDNRIPERLASGATTTLGGPVERHWVTGCGHVITVDYCREKVAELVLDFFARHAG
ncbi:MAG TPA: alpha/beta fold hydrolase [Gemmatimonadaceae bacterium]|nr:alpha/beta fold hydrolase [Gemmatimonadaceae bacterium]